MKKIGLVVVISILSITLFACSNQTKKARENNQKITHKQTKVAVKDVREAFGNNLQKRRKNIS